MTDAEKIAAFLATKGATKVATGANSGITARQFYLASRGDISLKPDESVTDGARELERKREENGYYKS